MRGGGTAGPSGDVDSDRAGDDGEYHHSRNLIKNIAVGKKTFKLSRMRYGDLRRNLPRLDPEGLDGVAARRSVWLAALISSMLNRRRSTPIQDSHGR